MQDKEITKILETINMPGMLLVLDGSYVNWYSLKLNDMEIAELLVTALNEFINNANDSVTSEIAKMVEFYDTDKAGSIH